MSSTRGDRQHFPDSGNGQEILPCPCGGAAQVKSSGTIDQIACTVCENETSPFCDGVPYAIQEWNAFCRGEEWGVTLVNLHMERKSTA